MSKRRPKLKQPKPKNDEIEKSTIRDKLVQNRRKKEDMIFKWLEQTCSNNGDIFFDLDNTSTFTKNSLQASRCKRHPCLQTKLPREFIGWDNVIETVASNNGFKIKIIIDHDNFCNFAYIVDDDDVYRQQEKEENCNCKNTCDYICNIYMNN